MAKSKSTRQPADSSVLSRACVRERAARTQSQLAQIKAQIHVLAAASQAMEAGHSTVEQCHISAALEALIAPCDELYEALDHMDGAKSVQAVDHG